MLQACMRNKMLKLSGAAAGCWADAAVPWTQANGSAADAAPAASAGAWAAHWGPSLDLGVGGAVVNGHAGCGSLRLLMRWTKRGVRLVSFWRLWRCQATRMHRTCGPLRLASLKPYH